MDVNNVTHYNANYHQAHAALVNLALNNGLGVQGNSRLSHGSPLISDYQRPAVYGLLAGQQGSPLVSHSSHQSPALYNSPGGPVGLDNYGAPAGSLGGQGAGGYQNLGAYNGSVQSVFNSALGSASDPYQTQRGGAYPY